MMLPAVLYRTVLHLPEPWMESVVFGIGIVGAAFLLAWAAEAAQVEISAGLAIAVVALLTVLPEYAVDMTFAWKAGVDPALPAFLAGNGPEPSSLELPAANLTGGNRLLSGFGWPLIILLFYWRRKEYVHLTKELAPEIIVLGLAGLYSILIFARGEIALWDTGVLILLFGVYLWLISKASHEVDEEAMIGPPGAIAGLPKIRRRALILALFAGAGGVVGISAEPFAEGLVHTGEEFGIDRFILVQWLAPLASESPEILVAAIFTLRGNPLFGMAALVSAAVNQWTLLVASLPIAFSLGLGEAEALPLNDRQQAEIFLTFAQIIFAVVLIAKLRIGWMGASVLGLVFITHLVFNTTEARYVYGIIFLVLTAGMIIVQPEHLTGLRDRTFDFRDALKERAGIT
jgi:cation:H+ antiporter